MKLRIRGNSLRMRLSQSETQDLLTHGMVEESVRFPGGMALAYAIVLVRQGSHVTAAMSGSRIEVRLPEFLAREWIESDQTGIERELALADGESLKLLMEKDFRCLHRRNGEDESNNFPNPADESQ